MKPLFECVIPTRVMVKKNSRQWIFRGGKKFLVPSVDYQKWADKAEFHVRQAARKIPLLPIDFLLEAHFKFYFENQRSEPDTSNCIEGPQDVLQSCGVIKNDRLIRRVRAEKFFALGAPRTEIALFQFER